MSARWLCLDCDQETANPSFSEGPKVVDQETHTVKRFTQARHVCPSCLSYNIKPIRKVLGQTIHDNTDEREIQRRLNDIAPSIGEPYEET